MASVVVSSFTRIGLFPSKVFDGLQLQTGCSTKQSVSLSGFQPRASALHLSAHNEKLQAALQVVQRACQLCLSVRSGMKQGEGQLDKVDNSPVTVADFGVQALISLELGRLFPNIPLVGEENASQLRAEYDEKRASGDREGSLVEAIVDALSQVVSRKLDCETVLDAIDRGAQTVTTDHRSYWVLDPIDGTRGFLRGGNALYVVGLALVLDGKPVLGVMGCPNVAIRFSSDRSRIQMASTYFASRDDKSYRRGLLMAAALGAGCWVKPITEDSALIQTVVDESDSLADSWFCISDHEVLSKTLLAHAFEEQMSKSEKLQVLPLCCGSLCKYFALALGGVSAFLLEAGPSAPLKVWDHASGVVCVTEAGGRVSDLEGTAVENLVGNGKETFTVEGGGILASNKALHELLLGDNRKRTAPVGQ